MYDDASVDEILHALRAPVQSDMGRVCGGMGTVGTDRLAALDGHTETYRTWSPDLISGLLQTTEYAYAAIRSQTPSLPEEEIMTRVRHRLARADAFLSRWTRREGRKVWLLMGESAILTPITDDVTHAAQLRHILEVSTACDSLNIQVLPDDATRAPRGVEPFSLFFLDNGARLGHLETIVGGWYTRIGADIARLAGTFSRMIDCAYTPADSREFIKEEVFGCWGHTMEPTTSRARTATPRTASTSPGPTPAASE